MVERPASLVLVLMGVSGSGKTTVAKLLAKRLHWALAEGDDFHPAANIAKMKSGTPLDDEDRKPWLHAIAGRIDEWLAEGRSGIVTCSALKRRYRDMLIGDRSGVRLVYLRGRRELIAARIAARKGHFMPSALLESQFQALEEPSPEEHPIVVPVDGSPTKIAGRIITALEAAYSGLIAG